MAETEKPAFIPSNPNNANVEQFRREINRKRGLDLSDYHDLHAYSIHPMTAQNFWQDVWDFVDIKASQSSTTV